LRFELLEVIQVYKDKVEQLSGKIIERFKEEKAEKMMEKAESQVKDFIMK
jgi:hypothetical protein